MKIIVGMIILAELLSTTPALAKPCTSSSVIGIWTLVSITASEPGVEDFYRTSPNEVMRFSPTGNFIYLASNRPFSAAEAGQRLDAAQARDRTSYRYSTGAGGRLLIVRQGVPFQSFRCEIADRVEIGARPGDIILSNTPAINRDDRFEAAHLRREPERGIAALTDAHQSDPVWIGESLGDQSVEASVDSCRHPANWIGRLVGEKVRRVGLQHDITSRRENMQIESAGASQSVEL